MISLGNQLGDSSCIGIVFAIVVGVILIGMMLPAVQRVREASRKTAAMNDLRQIGLAVENFKSVNPDLDLLATGKDTGSSVRVRQWFPETLLWRPEIITDQNGHATVEFDLADSITNWNVLANGVTTVGELGSTESSIRVFQPFFVDMDLPSSFTRGDEYSIPVVVYNYLDEAQTVKVGLKQEPWFELFGEPNKEIRLIANETKSVSFRVKFKQVGRHSIQVAANAGDTADAIRKQVDVTPDGVPLRQTVNGKIGGPRKFEFEIPDEATDGSGRAVIKIYPSTFSQLVEGIDAIFQKPYGCFEQTSSTTYPNILALDYMNQMKMSNATIEAKAREYIQLGYQRLIGFEVRGGGFSWFGESPADTALTAYGLMEFQDMSKVQFVDPALIQRTRQWLLNQVQSDGAWSAGRFSVATVNDRLATTAYIAWAVYQEGVDPIAARKTLGYLLQFDPAEIKSAYTLALVCNALITMNAGDDILKPYLRKLESLSRRSDDDKFAWWANSKSTLFYGSGRSANVATTALSTLALLRSKQPTDRTDQPCIELACRSKRPKRHLVFDSGDSLGVESFDQGFQSSIGLKCRSFYRGKIEWRTETGDSNFFRRIRCCQANFDSIGTGKT